MKLYREVAYALHKFIPVALFKGIQFVINHHTDSPMAREIIPSMISETGPDLIQLLPYFQFLSSRQTLSTRTINELMHNCTAMQHPGLPIFCLNNLITRNVSELQKLDQPLLVKFIEFVVHLKKIVGEQNVEAKLETMLSKMSQR